MNEAVSNEIAHVLLKSRSTADSGVILERMCTVKQAQLLQSDKQHENCCRTNAP